MEVQEKLDEISSEYTVGSTLPPEDAMFVLTYATPANDDANSRTTNKKNVSKTKSLSGTTVFVKGSIFHNTGKLHQSYGCNLTVKKTKGKTPKKYRVKVSCTAYGLGASGGAPFVAYKGSVSGSKSNANTFTAQLKEPYAALIALYDVSATVRVTTHNGDIFTIH